MVIRSILILFAFLTACHQKNISSLPKTTSDRGKVKDMRGLDGCDFMIITDADDKLLPVNWATCGVSPSEGLQVSFTYVIRTNMGGICMAEKHIIELKSIEIDRKTNKPVKKECEKLGDLFKSNWAKPLMIANYPKKVTRYKYNDGWAYYFMMKTGNKLYDCQGNLMCEDAMGKSACTEKSELLEPLVIWVVNE